MICSETSYFVEFDYDTDRTCGIEANTIVKIVNNSHPTMLDFEKAVKENLGTEVNAENILIRNINRL